MNKILGITDEITTCDCCGKSNLKRTVVLELEDGEVVHYGTSCAANHLGVPGRWTASNADGLVSKYEAVVKYEKLCQDAQIYANKYGKDVDIIKNSDGSRFFRLSEQNTGHRFCFPSRTFHPQA